MGKLAEEGNEAEAGMNQEDILQRYGKQLNEMLDPETYNPGDGDFSREYEIFRKDALTTEMTRYEEWCQRFSKVLNVRVKEEEQAALEESISIAHLQITAGGAASFAAFLGVLLVALGIGYGALSYFVFETLAWFIPLLLILSGVFSIKPLAHLPHYFANRWRLEASNQMVLCILYVVMYMRHTSNLEHAVKFAGEHIGPPLNLDLRKVFWDIETERFTTITESLNNYLDSWKKWNLEFVEAFHLIQGSLYETAESRRLELLDKALDVMVEGTYDKMLHFAHNLKNPITMLHMLGIILPILGLVLFPLIGSFLSGAIQWYHLALLYNIVLPAFVLLMGKQILEKRPTGYGKADPVKSSVKMEIADQKSAMKALAWVLFLCFAIIGLFPIIMHLVDPKMDFLFLGSKFLDFKSGGGPYGVGAMLLSLVVPLGAGLALSMYYRSTTRKHIELRNELEKLEKEFSGSLFLLGNKVEDGIPVEIAFAKVGEVLEDTATGNFFRKVSTNLQKLGMSLKEAIFDSTVGAIREYPSPLIESSMKVLVEGARKGGAIVAKSMITISTYVDKVRKVNERLNDLLSDIISSMRSQISFLTPVIAGIVVGVSSMVVVIINRLSDQFANLEQASDLGGLAGIANIINIKDVIPGFQFQIVVGMYVLEITLILIFLANGIERGIDPVYTRYDVGKTLAKSMGLYFVVSLAGIILFNMLASAVTVAAASTGA